MNALALAGLAHFAFALAEISPPPPPPPTPLPTAEQKETVSAHRADDTNPTDQPTRSAVNSDDRKSENCNSGDDSPKNWVMEILTGVLAIIAIIQVTVMRQSMRQDRINQRAWVATDGIQALPPVAEQRFIAKVRIKNTGKTFARNVTACCYSRAAPVEMGLLDFAQIVRDMEREKFRSVSLLAPGGVYETGSTSETGIRKDTADGFAEGKTRIFIFGKVTYTDIFGCEHWTTYCSILQTDGSLEVCETYNDADGNRA